MRLFNSLRIINIKGQKGLFTITKNEFIVPKAMSIILCDNDNL